MLKYNKNDKLLSKICLELNESELFKSIKSDCRTLHLYGIASTKSFDIAIPNCFPDGDYIANLLAANFSFRVMRGSLWALSETYNNRVLGLSVKIRKENEKICKKIIVLHYLALNGLLKTDNNNK